ncbi:Uncharacterized membrane protein [Alteribacillus persepolensis]|uniref:Uncharacterized membrane protein n=1 Tax=Alteribacillus persepolensis TaxID=568899 RepID=A0A1G8B1B5_9BACI|nr:DUF2243 domain-containing protein [Alteribacillus persepolensis]SDH26968.1 Uncharacterized membrane protein [Alteribacillus persepolensis]
MTVQAKRKFLIIGSFLMGFGTLGALDGIIFHQLLQWHSVVMETTRQGQIMSDGFFHLAVTITLIGGGLVLWIAGKPTDVTRGVQLLIGSFLIGGGVFNLLEGIINHHLLQIHRVKPGDPNALLYDLGFLAIGLGLFLAGYVIYRYARNSYVV